MKQIKIFTSISKTDLEKEVNDFIKNSKVKVLDIQYGGSPTGTFFHNPKFSVMIIIEEE